MPIMGSILGFILIRSIHDGSPPEKGGKKIKKLKNPGINPGQPA
jgi:hypothetical protein